MMHPGFPRSEYEARVRALQESLKEQGLAGAIVTSEANYNYFAGYHHFAPWTTFCRPVFCLLPAEGDPALLVHGFPAADARRDCWFDDVRAYDSLTFAPIPEVVDMAKDLGMLGERIGMELGSEHRLGLTAVEFDALRTALGPAVVEDASPLFWDLRVIKSPAEIAHHKESGRIAAHAFGRAFEACTPGMTERDVARVLGSAIHDQGGEVGFFIMTSGEGFYDRVAGLPRDRVLGPGDFLWIDLGVIHRGYWTDHCRAAVLGTPTPRQREMWAAVTALTRATVDRCRPGLTPKDIVTFIQEEGGRMGLEFSFSAGRSGHGIGLMSTEPPHIALYDDTELKPGMAFSIEPGWIDQKEGVFVAEENLVLTDDGVDLFTVTPRELVEV